MDSLRLIAEIKKRPSIWKSKKIPPHVAWEEVAACLGTDVTVDECKQNWKSLTESYALKSMHTEMRIEESLLNNTYDPKTDYSVKPIYFEHMTFMDDILVNCRKELLASDKTFCDEKENNDDYNETETPQNLTNENRNENSHFISKNDYNFLISFLPYLKSMPEVHNFQLRNEMSNLMLAMLTTSPPPSNLFETEKPSTHLKWLNEIGDTDANFLVSFLPHLTSLPLLTNLEFRSKLTDLFLNILINKPQYH